MLQGKKKTKSTNVSQSYSKNKSGTFVIETRCILSSTRAYIINTDYEKKIRYQCLSSDVRINR